MRVMILAAIMSTAFVVCIASAVAMVMMMDFGYVFAVSFFIFTLTVIYINRHSKELESEIKDIE